MPADPQRGDTYRLIKPWYRFVKGLTYVILKVIFGLRVIGKDRVPKSGPVLLVSNHVSNLDPPLVGCVVPRYGRVMAKDDLFKGWIGKLIFSVGSFPVTRNTADSGALRTAMTTLQDGYVLLIFPEGKRGDGVTLLPLQAGIAMLAEKSGAAVVPVGICGSHLALPIGAKKIRRAKVTIVFGQPFHYADVPGVGKEARALFLSTLLEKMSETCAEGGYTVRAFPATTEPSPSGSPDSAP